MRRILAAAVSALAFAGTGYSQELKAKWPGAATAELARIADRLGDRDYHTREEAGKLLNEAGADALLTLRKVVESGNPEAGERAANLIAKIEKRLANAKAIIGTPVQLKAEEQTLGAAFETLKKQTGYTIQLNGDQSPRSKKVTPKAGKLDFWEAMQDMMEQADLEVEAIAAIPTPVNLEQNLPRSGDVYEGPTPLPALGNVVVRQKTTKTANPVCISGAFRIEAIPVPVANLPQMPANRVPVLLHISPEPRFRWVGTTETLVTLARDQDGRTLAWDFVANDFNPNNGAYYGRRKLGGKAGYYGTPIVSSEFPVSPFQAYVKLAASPAGPSSTLKEFEGIVRGRYWSPPETMLAISGLGAEAIEVSGPNRTSLKAKVEPMPGDASALLLSVTMIYNSEEVVLANGASALNANPEGLWLENDPGGRVKVKLSSEERKRAQGYTNAYGLALVDGNGKPMNLSPHTATTQNYYDGIQQSLFAVMAQYVVRPATKNDADQPAKLTFNGSRVKTIEVPFAFKDVPVLLGTGTNVPRQQQYEVYVR